jgi:hypothetical protein
LSRDGRTTRRDPEPAADERTTLLQFLDYQRATLLGKCAGLHRAQLVAVHPPSTLTLAGLLKHLAYVEDTWVQERFLGLELPEPWTSAPFDDDPDWELHSAPDDDPQLLRELYQLACSRTRDAMATAPLDQLSQRPLRDGSRVSLRWIAVHLIEETARHNGHADLIRESIDGAVGE